MKMKEQNAYLSLVSCAYTMFFGVAGTAFGEFLKSGRSKLMIELTSISIILFVTIGLIYRKIFVKHSKRKK